MVYELLHQDKLIGDVIVKKIGLYYEIECQFIENKNGRFSMIAISDGREINLGECRYENGQFKIFRYMPINAVGHNLIQFHIKKLEDNERLYPVGEENPFSHIDKLDKAILVTVRGERRIAF